MSLAGDTMLINADTELPLAQWAETEGIDRSYLYRTRHGIIGASFPVSNSAGLAVLNLQGRRHRANVVKRGTGPLYCVTLQNGLTFVAGPDHRCLVDRWIGHGSRLRELTRWTLVHRLQNILGNNLSRPRMLVMDTGAVTHAWQPVVSVEPVGVGAYYDIVTNEWQRTMRARSYVLNDAEPGQTSTWHVVHARSSDMDHMRNQSR
jgi:hypothetical protein